MPPQPKKDAADKAEAADNGASDADEAADATDADDSGASDDSAADEGGSDNSASDESAADEEAQADSAGGDNAWADIDGEAIFNQACMACHATGAAGAPISGNAEQWAPHIEKGMETLYDHAINGFNAMPPKGGHATLSDNEVKAAVDHMVAESQ